jgi:hypothetical protein
VELLQIRPAAVRPELLNLPIPLIAATVLPPVTPTAARLAIPPPAILNVAIATHRIPIRVVKVPATLPLRTVMSVALAHAKHEVADRQVPIIAADDLPVRIIAADDPRVPMLGVADLQNRSQIHAADDRLALQIHAADDRLALQIRGVAGHLARKVNSLVRRARVSQGVDAFQTRRVTSLARGQFLNHRNRSLVEGISLNLNLVLGSPKEEASLNHSLALGP